MRFVVEFLESAISGRVGMAVLLERFANRISPRVVFEIQQSKKY